MNHNLFFKLAKNLFFTHSILLQKISYALYSTDIRFNLPHISLQITQETNLTLITAAIEISKFVNFSNLAHTVSNLIPSSTRHSTKVSAENSRASSLKLHLHFYSRATAKKMNEKCYLI